MFYQFREQVNGRGCYAGIVVKTKVDLAKDSSLNFEYTGDKRWEYVCKVATDIFFDYYKWLSKGELHVKIENVDWMPIDSNSLIILYATIDALCKSLNFEIPNFSFKKEEESFSFPECRILRPK